MSEATPRPWRVDPNHPTDVQDASGREILSCIWKDEVGDTWVIRGIIAAQSEDERDANAALIVRAVNAHDDLIVALEGARAWVAQYLDLPGHRDAAQSRLRLIDAALAKARGEM